MGPSVASSCMSCDQAAAAAAVSPHHHPESPVEIAQTESRGSHWGIGTGARVTLAARAEDTKLRGSCRDWEQSGQLPTNPVDEFRPARRRKKRCPSTISFWSAQAFPK